MEQKKQGLWEDAVNSIDFLDSSCKAWSTINKHTGRSGHSENWFIVYNVFTPARNARDISIRRSDKAHTKPCTNSKIYTVRGSSKKCTLGNTSVKGIHMIDAITIFIM